MEHVPSYTPTSSNEQQEERQVSLLSSEIIKIYSHYQLWDYCQNNILRWKQIYNLDHVQYLPLGFSPILYYKESSARQYSLNFLSSCHRQYTKLQQDSISIFTQGKGEMDDSNETTQNQTNINGRNYRTKIANGIPYGLEEKKILFDRKEMIDVLFYGQLLPYRATIIQELRAAGIRVYHANAVSYIDKTLKIDGERSGFVENIPSYRQQKRHVHGRTLDDLIANSKIILNLLSFGEEEEWKLTRLLKPLANAKCVVSEIHGTNEEREYLKGVVFTERNQLVRVIKELLKDENRREEQGQLARKSFSGMTMFESLSRLLTRYSNL